MMVPWLAPFNQLQSPMPTTRSGLLGEIENDADSDLAREVLVFVSKRLMEVEVEARTGTGHGLRDPARRLDRRKHEPTSRCA
jgi:hypothetical protein